MLSHLCWFCKTTVLFGSAMCPQQELARPPVPHALTDTLGSMSWETCDEDTLLIASSCFEVDHLQIAPAFKANSTSFCINFSLLARVHM